MGSGFTRDYLYPLSQSEIFRTYKFSCGSYSVTGVSANGELVLLIQGRLSPDPALCKYDSSTGVISETSLRVSQVECHNFGFGACLKPVISSSNNVIAIIDFANMVRIYNENMTYLGILVGGSEAQIEKSGAVVFNSDGSQVYTYGTSGLVRTFDLTATPANFVIGEIGSGTTLVGNPGIGVVPDFPASSDNVGVKMIISPDDGTIFISGSNKIIILPTP